METRENKAMAIIEWVSIFIMAVLGGFIIVRSVDIDEQYYEEVVAEEYDWTKDPSRLGLGPERTLSGIDIYLDENDNELYRVVKWEDGTIYVVH